MNPPPSTRPHAPGKAPALLTLTAGLSAALLVPLLSPVAAEAAAITATAAETFNPVLQVDAGTSSTPLTISGLLAGSTITKVTTTINLTKCDNPIDSATGACLGGGNSFNREIGLALQSPFGTVVNLIVPNTGLTGQTPGDTVTWTFTDSALGGISGNQLVSGTDLPTSPLSAFNGEAGNGAWTLFFTDSAGADPLSINSWSVTVEVPGPLPLLGVGAAFGYSRRLRRRISASQPGTPTQA
ncbi:MAG: proprotein convertase P-domain-containing protein [Cyanobium sp.]